MAAVLAYLREANLSLMALESMLDSIRGPAATSSDSASPLLKSYGPVHGGWVRLTSFACVEVHKQMELELSACLLQGIQAGCRQDLCLAMELLTDVFHGLLSPDWPSWLRGTQVHSRIPFGHKASLPKVAIVMAA